MTVARSKTVEKEWKLVDPIVQGHLEAFYRLQHDNQVDETVTTIPSLENRAVDCRAAIEAGMVEGDWSVDEVSTWTFKTVHERYVALHTAISECLNIDPN